MYKNRQWWDEESQKPGKYIPEGMYRPFSLYPTSVRDITVPDDETIPAILIANGGRYLETLWKVGEYAPKKNVTYRLVFQSFSRNLTREEVDEVMARLEKVIHTSPLTAGEAGISCVYDQDPTDKDECFIYRDGRHGAGAPS